MDHPDYGLLDYTPPYMQAVAAGYLDAWLLQRHHDEGYTSGFDEDVSDPNAELTSRIDFIFLHPQALRIKKVKCRVVGDEVSDMTPSGLWPSDHAGVVADVRFSKPKCKKAKDRRYRDEHGQDTSNQHGSGRWD